MRSSTTAHPAAGLTGLAKKKENKTPGPCQTQGYHRGLFKQPHAPNPYPSCLEQSGPVSPSTFTDWQGEQTHVILDRKEHVVGVLVAPPLPGQDWNAVVAAATAAMREARDKMTFPAAACQHRRASGDGFPAEGYGFPSAGGGKSSATLNRPPGMLRRWRSCWPTQRGPHGDVPHPLFATNIFADYHQTKQTLLRKNPRLHRTFARSPFTAVTANLGPVRSPRPTRTSPTRQTGCALSAPSVASTPMKGDT
ncbi:hypothetical protein B0H14DRAFT_2599810, partial [Mycena olivaceomarginata]